MGAGLIAPSSKPVRLDETSYTYFISSCRFRSHLHSRSSIIYEFFLLLLLCYTQPVVLWCATNDDHRRLDCCCALLAVVALLT